MIEPIASRKEILYIDTDKEKINSIRIAIAHNFPRSWVVVHVENDKYGIEVLSNWGNIISESKQEEIKIFIKSLLSPPT